MTRADIEQCIRRWLRGTTILVYVHRVWDRSYYDIDLVCGASIYLEGTIAPDITKAELHEVLERMLDRMQQELTAALDETTKAKRLLKEGEK